MTVVFVFMYEGETRLCATENTNTPARLEALFKLSVVVILRLFFFDSDTMTVTGCTQAH